MKKLIDKENLIEKIDDKKNELTKHCGVRSFLYGEDRDEYDWLDRLAEMVESEPDIEDVAYVKRGKWIFEVEENSSRIEYHVTAH